MIIALIAYLPSIIGLSVISFLIFLHRSRSKKAYTSFSVLVGLAVLWMLFQMLSLFTEDTLATLFTRISIVSALFMLAFFLYFALYFNQEQSKVNSFVIWAIFLVPAVLALVSFSDMAIVNVHNDGIRQEIISGPLYEVQSMYGAVYVLLALLLLGARIRHLYGAARTSHLLLLLSLAIPSLVNIFVHFVLRFDESISQYFFPTTIFLTAGVISYAMIKHQLFDIRLAAMRTAAYALSILTLGVMYYVTAYLASVLIFGGETNSSVSLSSVNIALALALALLFQPVKRFFDRVTDKIFFRDRYSEADFYKRLSSLLGSTTDLRGLLQRAAQEIGGTLKAEQALFYVWQDDRRTSAGTKGHTQLPAEDIRLLRTVDPSGVVDGVIVSELLPEKDKVRRMLISHRIAVVLPLRQDSKTIGYLLLGDHQAKSFTTRDIVVLATIADELTIAIRNALSVQSVKDINATLEQRIRVATKELRASNRQLRHLDAVKDEFLSMASHQLRTPLTSVKGYLSMVLEGDVGKISDQQRHLLGEAYTSSERMVHLIHDFLNVSRLQTGKFVIEMQPTDIVQLVQHEVNALRQVAGAHNMQLEFEASDAIPMVNIDVTKFQQVVMNYIDNALYYSRPENPVVKIRLEVVGDNLELRVIDGGIGVPETEKARLFEKFFRAGNARQQRPDGTGVGIYLAKKVIDAHGGEIIFESKVGKGSTFGFRLPLDKVVVPKDNSEAEK